MSDSSSTVIVDLPDPRLSGTQSLEETLATRRSVREFTDEPLSESDIGQLLWAAQGVTDPAGLRTSASAGALYPLEMYVVGSTGLYHFEPARHKLSRRNEQDLRPAIHRTALGQDALIEAPAVFVITAVFALTQRKYGPRGRRYVHMEAGHAAQNLLLQAAALNLGGVAIGAFNDLELHEILGLPNNEAPLYLIAVCHSQ